MKIKLLKFDERFKIPERKHYNDTGADIYMIESGHVFPHETIVVPLGFGIVLPDGYNAHIQNRTSIAQQGIYISQCAIDAGYRGEIKMIISNLSDKCFAWREGERLGYLEVMPITYADYTFDLGDERGDNAFGSTNVNQRKNMVK